LISNGLDSIFTQNLNGTQDFKIIFSKQTINGYTVYNASVKINVITYSSNGNVYSSGSKQRSSLSVGRYIDSSETAWYLTRQHAMFALWMVLMMNSEKHEETVEDKFLPHSDICIISPNRPYPFDIRYQSESKEVLPLCCMLKSGNEIVALDCGRIRFDEFLRWRHIDRGDGTAVDQLTHYYDESTRRWEQIHPERKNAYSLMADQHSIPPTVIGNASRNLLVKIPRNTKEVSTDKQGFVHAVVGSTDSKRTDNYWYYKKSKFRSSKEVDFFKQLVEEYEGDVVQAEFEFKRRLKERNNATNKSKKRGVANGKKKSSISKGLGKKRKKK